MIKIVLSGRPITKKNSSQIKYRNTRNGRKPFICPSEQFLNYQNACGWQLSGKYRIGVNAPINLKCVYYMPTNHKVDLCNLLSATCDILVHYGVIKDDNSKIVVSHDGSRVMHDKDNPRVEIFIEEVL